MSVLSQLHMYMHTKHNILNSHKNKLCKSETFWNSKYNTCMLYKHLAKVNIHHKRGKKLTAYGTQGTGMHHSYIKPGKGNNWPATGTIYHTKLKYNTSSVNECYKNSINSCRNARWKTLIEISGYSGLVRNANDSNRKSNSSPYNQWMCNMHFVSTQVLYIEPRQIHKL